MITRAFSVCFAGIEPQLVEIECAISPGLPAFSIIGLPDKAVSEARDRIRSALGALSIALPSRRITINLSPADMPKEGSHLDLPITLHQWRQLWAGEKAPNQEKFHWRTTVFFFGRTS